MKIEIINLINDVDSTNVLRIPMRHLVIHKDENFDLSNLYEKYESLVNEYKTCFVPFLVRGLIEGCVMIDSLNKNREVFNSLNSYTKEEIIRDFEICVSELFNFASSSTTNFRYVKSIFNDEIKSSSVRRNMLERFRFYFGDVLTFSDFSNEVFSFTDRFFDCSFKENRRDFFCYLDEIIRQLK